MKLGHNMSYNDKNMVTLPFPIFLKVSRFFQKMAILGQLRPEVPDRAPNQQLKRQYNALYVRYTVFDNSKCIYIKATALYLSLGKGIYQLVLSSY